VAKFLTVFNLVAGGASIGGLYVTLALEYQTSVIAIVFLIVAIICGYVLLVPNTFLERNVRSKLERYRDPRDGSEILIQRGTFSIEGSGSVAVEFPQPFADRPTVEVIRDRGKGVPPGVENVTSHQAVFRRSLGEGRQVFSWVARGVALQRLPDASGAQQSG